LEYLGTLLTITGVIVASVVSPGPNFVLVTSTSASVSRRAGLITGLGVATASCLWAALAVTGVGLLLKHAEWVHTAIRIAGAAYLIWLGIKMIAGARKPLVPMETSSAVGYAAARKGFVVNMTNPKSMAFYGSIFAVMVPAHAPTWVYATIVVITAVVASTWYTGLALLFSHGAVRRLFARGKVFFETTLGIFLVALGGRLLTSR
jgi:threonine/homoserine/homoserine lactone efflux protein